MGVVNKADMVGACHQGFHSLLITHHKHVGNFNVPSSVVPVIRRLQHVQSGYRFVTTWTTPSGSV